MTGYILTPLVQCHVFPIYSGYYLVILYSFRNLCRVRIVKTVAINHLTSTDPS
ncbi:hypothetical protein E2C01_058572 [Portunus trituberculatus]|uniref:Uncharacterized protein n=1 Tax=Portunus trituberculatus TaxID=210409 RepID=A0A5B7H3J5_PORTR|nr:hypothetical protein [Portunus trituberculatus]